MRRQSIFRGEVYSLPDQPVHLSPVGWRVKPMELSDPGAELRTACSLVAAGGPPYSLFTEDPRKEVHLIGSPRLRTVAMAMPSLQSFLQAWELPKEPGAAVQTCPPMSQGCPLPQAEPPQAGHSCLLKGLCWEKARSPFSPPAPGLEFSLFLSASSCPLLSRALEL